MQSSSRVTPLVIFLAFLALLPMLAMAPIKREATDNRDALTALETKPLDPAATASLTDWTHPGTLDADAIKGKVVLLAIVSSDPQSVMAISKLARMKRDFRDKGLIVAAIHPDAGFDQLSQKVLAGKIAIPVARDAGGVFASTLLADDYPDLYLIDRAGNLRFADFDRRSIKDAIKQLTAETPETAASNAARQAQGLEPELSAEVQKEQALTESKKKFSKAAWPSKNTGKVYARIDSQGKRLPMKLPEDKWVLNERSLENKVIILDFWKTGCSPCRKTTKIYAELLEAHPNKVEVVGISIDEDLERLQRDLSYGKRDYPQIHEPEKELYNALQIESVPHTIIISTDGIIRWQGFALSRGFRETAEQIIAADPNVQD